MVFQTTCRHQRILDLIYFDPDRADVAARFWGIAR